MWKTVKELNRLSQSVVHAKAIRIKLQIKRTIILYISGNHVACAKPFMYEIASSRELNADSCIFSCACARAFLRNKLYQIISCVHQCLVSIALFSLLLLQQRPQTTETPQKPLQWIHSTLQMLSVFFYHLKASKRNTFRGMRLHRIFLVRTRDDEVITINL